VQYKLGLTLNDKKMKIFFLFLVTISSLSASGQIKIINNTEFSEPDTTVQAMRHHDQRKAACFLNGNFVSPTVMSSLLSDVIEDFEVVFKSVEVEGVLYDRYFKISTRKNYNPKIITLRELREQELKLKKSAVFTIDDVLINAADNAYYVDQNGLSAVTIDKFKSGDTELLLIKITTKMPRSLKIRGAQYALAH
jgi:hypothetical protein